MGKMLRSPAQPPEGRAGPGAIRQGAGRDPPRMAAGQSDQIRGTRKTDTRRNQIIIGRPNFQ
jgi:hypothetical protein